MLLYYSSEKDYPLIYATNEELCASDCIVHLLDSPESYLVMIYGVEMCQNFSRIWDIILANLNFSYFLFLAFIQQGRHSDHHKSK